MAEPVALISLASSVARSVDGQTRLTWLVAPTKSYSLPGKYEPKVHLLRPLRTGGHAVLCSSGTPEEPKPTTDPISLVTCKHCLARVGERTT